jgi:hypothetical protein
MTATEIPAQNTVAHALAQAWRDSDPGSLTAHEEGGFVLRDALGVLRVERWPRGDENSIVIPPHRDCRLNECDIVATFHTHPNFGAHFLQEPSPTDRRAVRDDPDLKGNSYVGEFVIANDSLYLVLPNGDVSLLGHTSDILKSALGGER